jgi:hypothetical protein
MPDTEELERRQALIPSRMGAANLGYNVANTPETYNRAVSAMIGRTVTSCRFEENATGLLPDGSRYSGSAFLLEVEDGIMKLAIVPDHVGGFRFVFFNSLLLPGPERK